MRNLTTALLLLLVLSSRGGAATARKAGGKLTFQQKLQVSVPSLAGEGLRPIQLLVHTAFKYGMPFALEYADRDTVRARAQIKLPSATLQRRIESLVTLLPGLRVSFSEQLVDVYSPDGRAAASSLLNMVLPQVRVERLDAALAAASVRDLVAFERRQPSGFSSIGGTGGALVTIDAHNIRVYEVLNRIVSQQGHSMWVVGVPPDRLSKLNGELWHLYMLNPALEPTVVQRLLDLFPNP